MTSATPDERKRDPDEPRKPDDRGGPRPDNETNAESQLEEGLEDTFPASDPPAITQPVHKHQDRDTRSIKPGDKPAGGDKR